MGLNAAKFAASVLAVSLLIMPAGLSAKERRGAAVVVTRLDGSEARGELVAVKPDSLLLLGEGTDLAVGLADIKTVRIVRMSRAKPLALAGFLSGAAVGAYLVSRDEEDRNTKTTLLAAGGFGGVLGLLGFGIGLGLGADAVLPFAGEPDEVVGRYLDRLKGYSREGRLRALPEPGEVGPGKAPAEAPVRPPARPPRRPRFRLSMATTLNFDTANEYRYPIGSWRFLGDVPPGEAGPHPLTFYQSVRLTASGDEPILAGPISLAYEWNERWLAEVELFLFPETAGYSGFEQMTFVSVADGRTYGSPFLDIQRVDFDSLVIGLCYRPLAPGRLQRAALEVGAAAGPALARIGPSVPVLPAGRVVVPSVRVHAAFDYHFVPAFSLGTFFGYRYLQADFPAATGSGEMSFRDVADVYPYTTEPITRVIELTSPVRTVSRSGLTYGLRVSFRI